MSFGWSAGDVAGAIKLIYSIVSSLRNTSGAREQFQELETELFGLKRALERIDSLTQPASAPREIQALKFVSLYCVETLQRFHDKIKPFEDSLGSHSQMTRLQAAPRMVRWQLLVKKDLPELRQYLMAHVGYLNLELSTASLKSMSRANKSIEQLRLQNDRAIALIEQRIDNAATTKQSVDEIREIVERVWSSREYNNNLANMVRDLLQKTTTPPSTRYTWAQEPIRFENALGNVIPVASESDWEGVAGTLCASCGTWVRRSYKCLPKPLRPPGIGNVVLQPPETGHISVGPGKSSDLTAPDFLSSYPERIAYKNISIYVTELPPTPRFFRDRREPTSDSVTIRTMKLTSIPPAPYGEKIPSDLPINESPLRLASVPSIPPLPYHDQYVPASSLSLHPFRLTSLPAILPVPYYGQAPPASSTSFLTGESLRTTLRLESAQGAHNGAGGGGPTSENQRTVTYSKRFLDSEQYPSHASVPTNRTDLDPPCNTLFVGNLPPDTSEEELEALFSKQPGYKRLCFRNQLNGPICFVQFHDAVMASRAVDELYGYKLSNGLKTGISLSFSKNLLDVPSNQLSSMKPSNWPSELGLPESSSHNEHLTAAVVDLSERVDDWESSKMEGFGDLLRFGTFAVVKGDSGKDTEREYHIYLFERILLVCKDINPNRKGTKLIMDKDKLSLTSKGKSRLRLKGRIYMANVTDVVCLQEPGLYSIQIFWQGDITRSSSMIKSGVVDNFIIRYINDDTMRNWFQDIDAQRTIHYRMSPP
ncbi:putative Invasion-inducing protein TIAM1/CDC24 [Aspergillus udagawae]|nr:putative Invasion-inducing protein TIAM1/CDC24 [Aspergillus udagawae]